MTTTAAPTTVHVIGGGFSGLVSAYFLNKRGFRVEIFEKENRCGGLIQTIETPWGLCETAANGIINSRALEELSADIAVPLIGARSESRRRYIFRRWPRRWPLAPHETVAAMTRFSMARPKKPLPFESVEQWGARVLGVKATHFVLSPALQGIYAGDPKNLSASLILSRLFQKRVKAPRPTVRGTVAPRGGMGELVKGLENYLLEKGVVIHTGASYSWGAGAGARVICTSAPAAGAILAPISPALGLALKTVELLPLVSATVFYPKEAGAIPGFGVLFPRGQSVRALGVLFNNFIFEGRSDGHSETWIFGGAGDGDILDLKDPEIVSLISEQRSVLYGKSDAARQTPLGYRVQRWPQAIPHYTVDLEKTLVQNQEEIRLLENKNIFLAGNFSGVIGLGQIVERARVLPGKIR